MELANEYIRGRTADGNLADKKLFVENLGYLLKQTRNGIIGAEYVPETDEVVVWTSNETLRINVAGDSYTEIMYDVAKGLIYG